MEEVWSWKQAGFGRHQGLGSTASFPGYSALDCNDYGPVFCSASLLMATLALLSLPQLSSRAAHILQKTSPYRSGAIKF